MSQAVAVDFRMTWSVLWLLVFTIEILGFQAKGVRKIAATLLNNYLFRK
jgi:hypothetical protein